MPGPVSLTPIASISSSARVKTRTRCTSRSTSRIAWAALTRRLVSTWLRRERDASTGGRSAFRSRSSTARSSMSRRTIRSTCAMTSPTCTSSASSSSATGCAKTRRSRTTLVIVSMPPLTSRKSPARSVRQARPFASRTSAASSEDWTGRPSSASRSISAKAWSRGSTEISSMSSISVTAPSGLLTSCATPATSVPSAASFSWCPMVAVSRSCSRLSVARRSVRSTRPWTCCGSASSSTTASSAPPRSASRQCCSLASAQPMGRGPCSSRSASIRSS